MTTKQYGFYIDSAKCTGCKTCQVSCKDLKDSSERVNFRRVYEYTGGTWKQEAGAWNAKVFSYYLSIACNHCEKPACIPVCKGDALHKREFGLVILDEEECVNCKACVKACPYGAPQYDIEKGIMTKCDGCIDRVSVGKKPVCVESCPLRALDFAPIDELRKKYGMLSEVAPMPPSFKTKPSIVIKPNPNAKPVGSREGVLANPREV